MSSRAGVSIHDCLVSGLVSTEPAASRTGKVEWLPFLLSTCYVPSRVWGSWHSPVMWILASQFCRDWNWHSVVINLSKEQPGKEMARKDLNPNLSVKHSFLTLMCSWGAPAYERLDWGKGRRSGRDMFSPLLWDSGRSCPWASVLLDQRVHGGSWSFDLMLGTGSQ